MKSNGLEYNKRIAYEPGRNGGWAAVIRVVLKTHVRPRIIPVVRFLIRYVLPSRARRVLWYSVVQPYLRCARHDFVASSRYGFRLAGNTRDLLQRYFYYFGVWEPNVTGWLGSRLQPGDVFVDIGANVGYYTLLAAKTVGATGRVIAIEASPSIFQRLAENARNNGATNVELHHVAVSDRPGTVEIFQGPEHNIGMTTTIGRVSDLCEGKVRAEPLTAIISPETMRRTRVIKIDVEGGEGAVVAGMEPLLSCARRDLEVIVEVNPKTLRQEGRDPDDIVQSFARYGFTPHWVENDYAPSHYLNEARQPPRRLHGTIDRQMDIVFSRVNGAPARADGLKAIR